MSVETGYQSSGSNFEMPPGHDSTRSEAKITPEVTVGETFRRDVEGLIKQIAELRQSYKTAFGVNDGEASTLQTYLHLQTGNPQGIYQEQVGTNPSGEPVLRQVNILSDPEQASYRQALVEIIRKPEATGLVKALKSFEVARLENALNPNQATTSNDLIVQGLHNPNLFTTDRVQFIERASRAGVADRRDLLVDKASKYGSLWQTLTENTSNNQPLVDYLNETRELRIEGKRQVVPDRTQLGLVADLLDAGLIRELLPNLTIDNLKTIRLDLVQGTKTGEAENPSTNIIVPTSLHAREAFRVGLIDRGQYLNFLHRGIEQQLVVNKNRASKSELRASNVQTQANEAMSSIEGIPSRKLELAQLLESQSNSEVSETTEQRLLNDVLSLIDLQQKGFESLAASITTTLRPDELRLISSLYTGSTDPQNQDVVRVVQTTEIRQYYEKNPQVMTVLAAIERGIQHGLLDPAVRSALKNEVVQKKLELADFDTLAAHLSKKFFDYTRGLTNEIRPKKAEDPPSYQFALFDSRSTTIETQRKTYQLQQKVLSSAMTPDSEPRALLRALDDFLDRDRTNLDLVQDLGKNDILFSASELQKSQWLQSRDQTTQQNLVRDINLGLDQVRQGQQPLQPERAQFYQAALKLRDGYRTGVITSRSEYGQLLKEAAQNLLPNTDK